MSEEQNFHRQNEKGLYLGVFMLFQAGNLQLSTLATYYQVSVLHNYYHTGKQENDVVETRKPSHYTIH